MDLLVEAELRRAASQTGCPLCRVGEEAADRYLRSTLHEGVNDGATRSRLDRSWGFCRRHAWHFLGLEWEQMHDGLSTATLAEGLVEAAEQVLDALLEGVTRPGLRKGTGQAALEAAARALAPAEPCRACQVQAEHESYAAAVVIAALEDPVWRRLLAASDGFCLPHVRAALLAAQTPARAQWLVEDHRHRLLELRVDLEEYGRKRDHRFTGEARGREADAPTRATGILAGSWFDLPRWPRAVIGTETGVARTKEDEGHG